jgi:propionate CoA-transferase
VIHRFPLHLARCCAFTVAVILVMRVDVYSLKNVSKVGNKLTGPGGFIDISQCTKRVNFLGTFTAGGLEISAANGKLEIVKEGSVKKFVKAVREVTFCGAGANKTISQKVNYITERCVFELDEYNQLELVEIAPGIDLEKDILGQMDFMPKIKQPLRLMDPAIFTDAPMQLRELYFSDIGTTSKHPQMTSTA